MLTQRREKRLRALGIAALITALFGCSSDSSGDSEAACNSLIDDGPAVSITAVTTAAPAALGGTIAEGTYHLAAMTLYGSSAAAPAGTFSAVFQIAGRTMQQVGSVNGTERRYTSTFTISGTSISTVDSCPEPDSGSHAFSASPSEFSIYDSTPNGTVEQTYSKR